MASQAQWLTKEHTLYAEEERTRPVPRGCLLQHLEGDDSIKWKVLPCNTLVYCRLRITCKLLPCLPAALPRLVCLFARLRLFACLDALPPPPTCTAVTLVLCSCYPLASLILLAGVGSA